MTQVYTFIAYGEFPPPSCIVFFTYVPSMLRLVVVHYVRRNSDTVFSGKVHIYLVLLVQVVWDLPQKAGHVYAKFLSVKVQT